MIDVLNNDFELRVGRNPSQGACFFQAINYIFPEWSIERQKLDLIQAAEKSAALLRAVVHEMDAPYFVPSFKRRIIKGKSLVKESGGVPLTDPLMAASGKGKAKPNPTKKKKNQAKLSPGSNKFSPITLDDDGDDESDDKYDSDSEYSPSSAESLDDEDTRSKSPRRSSRLRKSKARARPSRSLQSKKGDSSPSQRQPRSGTVSIVWGLKKHTSKTSLVGLASENRLKAPRPATVSFQLERFSGRFHLVVHDSPTLAAKWREQLSTVSGLSIKEWIPRNNHASSTSPPAGGSANDAPSASPLKRANQPSAQQAGDPSPAGSVPSWVPPLVQSLVEALRSAPPAHSAPGNASAPSSSREGDGRPGCRFNHNGCSHSSPRCCRH
jgi:hypothetical protein